MKRGDDEHCGGEKKGVDEGSSPKALSDMSHETGVCGWVCPLTCGSEGEGESG
jgi:hypothetical protein